MNSYIGIPLCPNGVDLAQYTIRNNGCDVSLTWQQPPNTPPVTSTTVTYCPTSSPNCGNSVNCTTSTCNISGLDSGTEYQFTVIPNNNCGSPNGCTWNNVTHSEWILCVCINIMYVIFTSLCNFGTHAHIHIYANCVLLL